MTKPTDMEGRDLISKIKEIVAKQSHSFSEGEIRSLHRAMEWISEASKKLEEHDKS
jgi:hypothetical protein